MKNLRLVALASLVPLTLGGCANFPEWDEMKARASPDVVEAKTESTAPSTRVAPAAPRDLRWIVDKLQDGQIAQGKAALVDYIEREPENAAARSLLRQIDTDPVKLLGSAHRPYTVQRGDTLGELAAHHLGDPIHFLALARYNGIVRPRSLQAGQTLKIPTTRPEKTQVTPPASSQPSQPPQTTVATVATVGATISALPAAQMDRGDTFRRRIEADLDAGRIDEALEGVEHARASQGVGGRWESWLEPLARRARALHHQQQGVVLMRQGDEKAAHAAFGLALAQEPGIEPARQHHAELRTAVVNGYHEEAIVHYRNQQLDEAIALWDKVLELDPGFEPARGYRTRAIELKRRLKELGSS